MSDEVTAINELEERASKLASLLGFARRAFVLELAGTPKAGKSTSVEAIRHFFSRNGFRVHVLAERAAVCPIPMKGHLFFNAWCMTTMIAELLANVETETDIIIVDRGIFDALVWLNMQHARGELTADEAGTFSAFALMSRWTSLLDIAVVMNVDPAVAMDREQSQRIATGDGSIMNIDVLSGIHKSVGQAVKNYNSHFRKVIEHESSSGIKSSNISLIGKILDNIDGFLDPEILVVPKTMMSELDMRDVGNFSAEAVESAKSFLARHAQFMRRSEAEMDDSVIQIIACATLCYNSKVFRFERKEKDPNSNLYGKFTLWQGAHVPRRDGDTVVNLIAYAGMDRVNEQLFLGRNFNLKPAGYAWTKDEKHFGFIMRLDISNSLTATDLKKKEFKRARGHGLSGELVEWEALRANLPSYNLEPWSLSMVADYKSVLGLQAAV